MRKDEVVEGMDFGQRLFLKKHKSIIIVSELEKPYTWLVGIMRLQCHLQTSPPTPQKSDAKFRNTRTSF